MQAIGSEANQRGHGWLPTTHQNKSKASAGSRNSLETVYTAEKVLRNITTPHGKPQRDVLISAIISLRICDPQ
jgi:hypothetical protein